MKKWLNQNKILILIILILSGIMFYYNSQKQGFHEDEMFSYGSSNYKYDNVFRPYGYTEAKNDYLYSNILQGNIWNQITNFIDFTFNTKKYEDNFDSSLNQEIPTWKTKEEANEYLSIQKDDIFNFASVWYNQLLDVHPPMFYNFIHIFSIFSFDNFSKYIGFFLNLIFFIGTLIGIYQISRRLTNQKWSYLSVILYGGSMGAISTVMFHRMYMMLTYFSIWYLFYALKYFKKDGNINKKDKILWSIIIFSGFLTQYYFCIYIVLIFLIFALYYIYHNKWNNLKNLFLIHAFPALIGILLFPSSIEDIFFSYRGLGATENHTLTLIEFIIYYFNAFLKYFSIPLILIIGFIIYLIYKLFIKKVHLTDKMTNIICLLPIILFTLIISKIAPFLGENYTSRYIMLLLPIIAITLTYLLYQLNTSQKSLFITLFIILGLNIYGYITQIPTYLYKSYEQVMEIADQNQDKYFIYIYDNNFTHLSSMPEFLTYQKSLIINHNIYDFENFKKDDELKSQKEVVLCIKNWLNTEELIQKVLENTQFKNAEPLLSIDEDIESNYYLLS